MPRYTTNELLKVWSVSPELKVQHHTFEHFEAWANALPAHSSQQQTPPSDKPTTQAQALEAIALAKRENITLEAALKRLNLWS